MLKRILVGIGGSDHSMSAFRQAIEIAREHGAELTGISVLDERRLKDLSGGANVLASNFVQDLAQDRAEKAKLEQSLGINEFEKACDNAGLNYKVFSTVGEPFDVIIDQARYHDLMVFGLHGSFEFDVIEDPKDYLAKLVGAGVRPIIATAPEYKPVRKVLIAYSGSLESAKTIKHFMQSRLWPDAQLRIVCFGRAHGDPSTIVRQASDYCRAHGYQAEGVAVDGSPISTLIPYAQDYGADLIVMGNSARQLLMRQLFGETALHVIRNSPIALYLAQ